MIRDLQHFKSLLNDKDEWIAIPGPYMLSDKIRQSEFVLDKGSARYPMTLTSPKDLAVSVCFGYEIGRLMQPYLAHAEHLKAYYESELQSKHGDTLDVWQTEIACLVNGYPFLRYPMLGLDYTVQMGETFNGLALIPIDYHSTGLGQILHLNLSLNNFILKASRLLTRHYKGLSSSQSMILQGRIEKLMKDYSSLKA